MKVRDSNRRRRLGCREVMKGGCSESAGRRRKVPTGSRSDEEGVFASRISLYFIATCERVTILRGCLNVKMLEHS